MIRRRKEHISIGVILMILAVFIISIFTVPALLNLKNNFEISRYESIKASIIDSAKSKFSASVSDIGKDEVIEYTVKDLIKEGYFKGNEINPLTNKKYNDEDKVVIITKNGSVSYKIISGKTLIKEIKESNIVKNINNEYYYSGSNPSNYISFRNNLYRIVKVDKNDNIYIINNQLEKEIKKSDVESFINSYKNDNYEMLDVFKEIKLLDYNTYLNTKNGKNNSYLDVDNYIYLTQDEIIKVYDNIEGKLIDNTEKAWIRPIIMIDNTLMVERGDGSRIRPYIVN